MPLINNRIVGQVDDQVRIFYIVPLLFWLYYCGSRRSLITAQNRFYSGYQFFGVKWFDHIVISAQFQTKDFIKDLTFGGKHDNRYLGTGTQLPAYLVAVHAWKHQV